MTEQEGTHPPPENEGSTAGPAAQPASAGGSAPTGKAPQGQEDEYEEIDLYTAEVSCKCGRKLAANAWFCPRCGRVFLINMLLALVVLATGFALMTQAVQYLLGLLAKVRH